MSSDRAVEDLLRLLSDPGGWRIVSSALGPEVEPIDCLEHRRWALANTDAHLHQEVFALLEGEGKEWFQGQVYPSAPGTFFCFDAFEEHEFGRPPWAPDARELWIHPLPAHVVVVVEQVVDGRLNVASRWICPLSWEEVGLSPGTRFAPDPELAKAAPEAVRLRLVGLIAAVLAALALRGRTPDPHDDRDLPEIVVDAVCNHLRHTAGRDATIEHLSRIAGYSPFHFVRLFKRHTGLTVHQYVDRCRSERVAEMEGRGARQKEIAAALGFSSPATYSRWYHRRLRLGGAPLE